MFLITCQDDLKFDINGINYPIEYGETKSKAPLIYKKLMSLYIEYLTKVNSKVDNIPILNCFWTFSKIFD
jgi:hypothetical protein